MGIWELFLNLKLHAWRSSCFHWPYKKQSWCFYVRNSFILICFASKVIIKYVIHLGDLITSLGNFFCIIWAPAHIKSSRVLINCFVFRQVCTWSVSHFKVLIRVLFLTRWYVENPTTLQAEVLLRYFIDWLSLASNKSKGLSLINT